MLFSGRGNRAKNPLLLTRLLRDDRFSNDGSHEETMLRAIAGRRAPLHPLQQHAAGPIITGSFSSVNSLVNHSAQYPMVDVRVRGKRNRWRSNFQRWSVNPDPRQLVRGRDRYVPIPFLSNSKSARYTPAPPAVYITIKWNKRESATT